MAEKVHRHAYELPAEFSYSNECRKAVRNVSICLLSNTVRMVAAIFFLRKFIQVI